jgi:hypothetical protein
MPFQSLHDILVLKVPNENRIIFTATDYPIAASYTERSKATVFFIAMARVCLQTFASVVIP